MQHPRYHEHGQFAGSTIRTELEELQAATHGRKCAAVDKRVLDPPPVVLVRFFHVTSSTPTSEVEIQDYSVIDTAGLVCAVDLFPVPQTSATSSTVASFLIGSKFVQPIVTDHPETGRSCLVFPFANLSVSVEGDFCLRYRVFDILAGTSDQGNYPVTASCFGGPFRIYSSNTFPGLSVSTPLTIQLSKAGERVNVRQRERRKPDGKDQSTE